MHYFSNLFDKVLYMFWTCPSSGVSKKKLNGSRISLGLKCTQRWYL